MDLLTALVVLVIGTFAYAWLKSPSDDREVDKFVGFLRYREDGWPRGVQEGEPIPWDWASMRERGVPEVDREPAPDAGVKVIDIDSKTGAAPAAIDRGQISGGTSVRAP
jgi:hypothetical protein